MRAINQVKQSILGLVLTSLIAIGAQAATPSKQQGQPLPAQEVEQFVTAISVIQHYYIKDLKYQKLFENAIEGMVTKLDPHSSYLNKQDLENLQITSTGKFAGVGIEILPDNGFLKVIAPIDGSPAKRAGIKAGDIIVKVNNKFLKGLDMQEAINLIRGKIGSKLTLTILRKNEKKPLVFKLVRENVKVANVTSKLLNPGYAYVRLAFFQAPIKAKIKKAIKKLRKKSNGKLYGLVLDLRNNPGGLLDSAVNVSDLFLSPRNLKKYHGLIVYTKGRAKGADIKLYAKANDIIPNVPMVVLINQGSASGSEIVAGALQDYRRAVIMGQRSFGKGSVQTVLPISKNSAIKLTTSLYYTPAGRSIQAKGIEPDIIIPEFSFNKDTVNESQSDLLKIMESDLSDHIKNSGTSPEAKQQRQAALQKENLDLAHKDYQLYSALMMLKGMHAIE